MSSLEEIISDISNLKFLLIINLVVSVFNLLVGLSDRKDRKGEENG